MIYWQAHFFLTAWAVGRRLTKTVISVGIYNYLTLIFMRKDHLQQLCHEVFQPNHDAVITLTKWFLCVNPKHSVVMRVKQTFNHTNHKEPRDSVIHKVCIVVSYWLGFTHRNQATMSTTPCGDCTVLNKANKKIADLKDDICWLSD